MTADDGSAPDRPAGVPQEAEWSPEDNEWVLGARNSAGQYGGEVSYWRPDGTLCCICEHDAGKPHGRSRRFHESGAVSQTAWYERGELNGTRTWFASNEPTTEKMHTREMSRLIERAEVDYVGGKAIAFRYFDAAGEQVGTNGKPLRSRPASVPAQALFHEPSESWIAGTFLENGDPSGPSRTFTADGALYAEENWKDGKRDGACTYYRPDGSRRSRFHFAGGRLDGLAELWRRDGSLARRALYGPNGWAGPIEELDAGGVVVRSERVEEPPAPRPLPELPADEKEQVEALLDEEMRADAADELGKSGLSPAGMALAIARGWGSAERDAGAARACRALVRKLAPASLAERLAQLGLARAPRLITEERASRALAELGADPAVDGERLGVELVGGGGVGLGLALAAGGARARDALERRVVDRRLSLQRQALRELPREIRLFPFLESVDLSHNRLRTLPPEIGDLLRLARLELGENQIESLPAQLCDLSELRSLHLENNALSQLPPELCRLGDVVTLNLSYNELTTLPEAFGDLAALHTLWLNDNPLTDLPASFARLGALVFLHLGDVEWEEPPACIFELPALEELWIASPELKRLPPAVARIPRLRKLHLWYSSLTSLPEELFEMRGLEELRISDNPLPDGTVERLREALPDCTIY